MHLWFRQMAEKLNVRIFNAHPFNDQVEIPFTEGLVKEMLYKPIIKAIPKNHHQANRQELSDPLRCLYGGSEKKGIYVPFPQSIKDEL